MATKSVTNVVIYGEVAQTPTPLYTLTGSAADSFLNAITRYEDTGIPKAGFFTVDNSGVETKRHIFFRCICMYDVFYTEAEIPDPVCEDPGCPPDIMPPTPPIEV